MSADPGLERAAAPTRPDAGRASDPLSRPAFARLANTTIRARLLRIALVPTLIALPILGGLLLWGGSLALDQVLNMKVRSDLAVARGYFERVRGEIGTGTQAVASSHALQRAITEGRDDELRRLLAEAGQRHRFDFVNLLDTERRVVQSADGQPRPPRPMPALATDDTGASAAVATVDTEVASLILPTLLERIPVPLVPTRNAAPTPLQVESRALLLVARAPVTDPGGRRLGYVQGGVLLNRNLPFIDHINQIVYPPGSLPLGSLGTATLFLGDVRVSTNVRLFGAERDERAIGTRVSQAVRDAVLGRGETWLDRAFVVDDWYVSGYEPLLDGTGQRIGMLYVGFLERPFRWVRYLALASLLLAVLSITAVAAVLSGRLARRISRPIERMDATMNRIESGDASARVGAVDTGDEVARLASHFDHLLDTLDEKTEALRRWGLELDSKVAERTRELEASHRSLKAAQERLLRSEKLATIGQLAASVAHEVNNPLAVLQGNLDLIREELGERAAPWRGEFALLDQQIERMRLIVSQLLQHARPTEFAGYVEPLEPDRVIDDSLLLLRHELARRSVSVLRRPGATRTVAMNRGELQQVLVNLVVNAIQAMPEGGTLVLATADWEARGARIDVIDSGPGIDPAVVSRLFEPFVTSKADGTGLGLWISRTLVERYGGTITAAARDDARGSVFSVWLLSETPGRD